MTALFSAGTALVILGLVGVVAGFLWVIGAMVDRMAKVLSQQVAPGASAVAGHVKAMAPAVRRLDAVVSELS